MKTQIKNRHKKQITIVVENKSLGQNLAFVMHGLGSNKERQPVRTIAEAFIEQNYTVVTFDARNTFGESEGEYENATISSYYEDLEDVIEWAKTLDWYNEPFVLAGHSLGGIATAIYASRYPEAVKALAPIATTVNYELSLGTPLSAPRRDILEKWQKDGYLVTQDSRGNDRRLGWNHMEDRKQYDLLLVANKITMPVLMVVGDKDEYTPESQQRAFYDKLDTQKELHIIEGSDHSFSSRDSQQKLKQYLTDWLQGL